MRFKDAPLILGGTDGESAALIEAIAGLSQVLTGRDGGTNWREAGCVQCQKVHKEP